MGPSREGVCLGPLLLRASATALLHCLCSQQCNAPVVSEAARSLPRAASNWCHCWPWPQKSVAPPAWHPLQPSLSPLSTPGPLPPSTRLLPFSPRSAGAATARTLLGCPIAVGIKVGVDSDRRGAHIQGVATLRNTGSKAYYVGKPSVVVKNPPMTSALKCPGTTIPAKGFMTCTVGGTTTLDTAIRLTSNTSE